MAVVGGTAVAYRARADGLYMTRSCRWANDPACLDYDWSVAGKGDNIDCLSVATMHFQCGKPTIVPHTIDLFIDGMRTGPSVSN
jgi:hypothetical protein